MAWIKRNLILVISGGVALLLLGLGGYYLYSAIQKNQQIDTDIGDNKEQIKRLLEKPVTPTAENLKLAKQEGLKLGSFVAEAKRLFPPTPAPSEPLTSPSFKSLLANTVTELHRQASAVPTRLDSNAIGLYYFTFEAQRQPLSLPQESLRPLYDRLNEVQFIAEVLFKSRVNRLVSLRRAAVVGERPVGAQPGVGSDYLPASARVDSDSSMVLWPYELVFDCFTPELATVIEGLQGAKYGVLIKSIEVRPADDTVPAPGMRNPIRGQPPIRGANQPPTRVPNRGGAVAAPAAAAASGGSPLVTIINEKLLRVTLQMDIIKPDTGAAGGPGSPGNNRRGGGPGRPPGGLGGIQ